MSVSVQIDNLTVRAGHAVLLEGVAFSLAAGKLNALIGPNGAGKTTLLEAILGFRSFEGAIRFGNGGRPRIGYVPQRPEIDRESPVTVCDFLAAGLSSRPVWFGRTARVNEEIHVALADVGVGYVAHYRLGDLSGGEFQRVLLAHAILRKPDLLLLDEPQTGVDIIGARMFCGLIEDVHSKRDMTTLIVSHDLGVVADHAKKVIGLNRKVVFEGDCPEILTQDNLKRLFGPHGDLLAADHRGEHNHVHNGIRS